MPVRKYLKAVSILVLVPILASACAMTGEDMRAKAREAYTVPADTADLTLQTDIDRCQKEAVDAADGFTISGSVLIGLGVLVWPLIPIGLVVALTGAAKGETVRDECMSTAGYLKK